MQQNSFYFSELESIKLWAEKAQTDLQQISLLGLPIVTPLRDLAVPAQIVQSKMQEVVTPAGTLNMTPLRVNGTVKESDCGSSNDQSCHHDTQKSTPVNVSFSFGNSACDLVNAGHQKSFTKRTAIYKFVCCSFELMSNLPII